MVFPDHSHLLFSPACRFSSPYMNGSFALITDFVMVFILFLLQSYYLSVYYRFCVTVCLFILYSVVMYPAFCFNVIVCFTSYFWFVCFELGIYWSFVFFCNWVNTIVIVCLVCLFTIGYLLVVCLFCNCVNTIVIVCLVCLFTIGYLLVVCLFL